MISAVADTHAVIWYIFGDSRLSPVARATFDGAAVAGDQIALSSITLAEIVYLMERGRIAATTLDELLGRLDRPTRLWVSFCRPVTNCLSTTPTAT